MCRSRSRVEPFVWKGVLILLMVWNRVMVSKGWPQERIKVFVYSIRLWMNKNVHCQILLKCWSFITLKGWGWPSWESLEDFQTDSPLHPSFLEITPHPPVNFEYCENDPGAPLTYFNDGGVRRIFWGLRFWPKGIFLGLWKTPGFFWVAKTTQGFFGYCILHQLKSTIT